MRLPRVAQNSVFKLAGHPGARPTRVVLTSARIPAPGIGHISTEGSPHRGTELGSFESLSPIATAMRVQVPKVARVGDVGQDSSIGEIMPYLETMAMKGQDSDRKSSRRGTKLPSSNTPRFAFKRGGTQGFKLGERSNSNI